MTEFLAREITPHLREALETMPVVVLSGLRQVGKSTLLQNDPELLRGRSYVTLDDFATLASARRDPHSLLHSADALAIDEAQRCPELLVGIKQAVDRDRRPGRFLLSGSANLALLKSVSETLAGRALYLNLEPMTRRELRGATRRRPRLLDLFEGKPAATAKVEPVAPREILAGGLPPVCVGSPRRPRLWFRGYEQTYVERDLRQLSQITDLIAFRTLMQLAALRTGQVLNISSLARDAKLNAMTAARYMGLLETAFLLRKVPPYLKNRSSRLIKSPKLYLTDSGLAAHLAGVEELDATADEPLRGPLFETWLAQNLSALLAAHLPEATLSFWHEQGRYEVDFVIENRRRVVAVELKAASRWAESDLAGLRAFLDRTSACVAAVLAYNGATVAALGPRLWAVPLGDLVM